MTYGKRKFEEQDAIMRRLIPPLHDGMMTMIPMIDADTSAFNDYLAALGMPKDDDAQKAERGARMTTGLKKAIAVPMQVLHAVDGCWDAMLEMAKHGNRASRSDLEVGARCLELGAWGAYRNVVINLESMKDPDWKAKTLAEAESIAKRAKAKSEEVLAALGS
jgi:glutamate formiminotransferase/formiminotetrahydrofolate cyclodeaminase